MLTLLLLSHVWFCFRPSTTPSVPQLPLRQASLPQPGPSSLGKKESIDKEVKRFVDSEITQNVVGRFCVRTFSVQKKWFLISFESKSASMQILLLSFYALLIIL